MTLFKNKTADEMISNLDLDPSQSEKKLFTKPTLERNEVGKELKKIIADFPALEKMIGVLPEKFGSTKTPSKIAPISADTTLLLASIEDFPKEKFTSNSTIETTLKKLVDINIGEAFKEIEDVFVGNIKKDVVKDIPKTLKKNNL